MVMSETELLALLRELDDPERLERPLNYDRAASALAFGGLVGRLKAHFGVQCEFEQDTQGVRYLNDDKRRCGGPGPPGWAGRG